MTPTVRNNQVHCPDVVQCRVKVCSSLMSTALLVCRGNFRNLRADCSTFWLYCV